VLHPELTPNTALVVAPAANFLRLVELFARRGFPELTARQIEALLGLTTPQIRGLLHTGWAAGWLRPVQDDPETKRIDRWTLAAIVPRLGERYRQEMVRRAQALDDQFREFIDGPVDAQLKER